MYLMVSPLRLGVLTRFKADGNRIITVGKTRAESSGSTAPYPATLRFGPRRRSLHTLRPRSPPSAASQSSALAGDACLSPARPPSPHALPSSPPSARATTSQSSACDPLPRWPATCASLPCWPRPLGAPTRHRFGTLRVRRLNFPASPATVPLNFFRHGVAMPPPPRPARTLACWHWT